MHQSIGSLGRRVSVLLLLCLFATVQGLSQERVTLIGGRVSFEIPEGFREMTAAEISLKYPSANPPDHAYANAEWDVSIAVTHSPSELAPEDLTEYKNAMERLLPRLIPGLEWITREMVDLDGRRWVHFELRSLALDTGIHNHMYMTSLEGRMLGINLNSTEGRYEGSRRSLERTRDSIRVID